MTDDEPRGEEFRAPARRGLAPAEVRALSQLSSLRGAWAVAQSLALIAGCVAAALLTRGHTGHALVVAAAIVGLAGAQHQLAVLAHEAAHHRLLPNRRLNDVVGRACAAPLGLSMLSYRLVHRIHHNHLYEAIDPDLALMAGYPRGKYYLLGKLIKDLSGLTTLKTVAYFTGQSLERNGEKRDLLADTSPSLRRAARRDRRLVAVVYFGLLAAALISGFGRLYLLLWVLPLITLLQAILRLRAIMEHGAVADTSSPFTAARTNFVPVYLYWILFPHHVHYHIEHHLYPSIPHYHLRRCHQLLRERGLLDGAAVARLPEALRLIFAERRAPAA